MKEIKGGWERAERSTTNQFMSVRGIQGFFFSFVAAKVLLGTSSSLFLEPLLPCQCVSRVISFLTVTWQPLLSSSSHPLGLLTLYTAPYWLADVKQTEQQWCDPVFSVFFRGCLFFCFCFRAHQCSYPYLCHVNECGIAFNWTWWVCTAW